MALMASSSMPRVSPVLKCHLSSFSVGKTDFAAPRYFFSVLKR